MPLVSNVRGLYASGMALEEEVLLGWIDPERISLVASGILCARCGVRVRHKILISTQSPL